MQATIDLLPAYLFQPSCLKNVFICKSMITLNLTTYYVTLIWIPEWQEHKLRYFQLFRQHYHDINNNIDTISVYVDFQKALDTVDHVTLLTKLKQFNFSSHAISLFGRYLSNRTQQVFVNKNLSRPNIVSTGVPQGSTLEPPYFIMYIDDLPTIFKNCSSLLFVDDTVLFHPVQSNFDMQKVCPGAK